MDKTIELLNNIQPLLVVGTLALFFTLETFWPFLTKFKSRSRHFWRNIILMVSTLVVNSLCALGLIAWLRVVEDHHLGLLNMVDLDFTTKVIAGLFLIDFGDYLYHILTHKWRILWGFHRVHHSDIEMDATTSVRFHPLEILALTFAQVVHATLFGWSVAAFVIYYSLYLPLVVIQHANIRFPFWVENTLGMLFSTPEFHRVHHAADRQYTDSNYGDVFTLWDRLFGTYHKVKPEDLEYGLADFKEDHKQTLGYLLMTPFRK